jgi:hypothetical protein
MAGAECVRWSTLCLRCDDAVLGYADRRCSLIAVDLVDTTGQSGRERPLAVYCELNATWRASVVNNVVGLPLVRHPLPSARSRRRLRALRTM